MDNYIQLINRQASLFRQGYTRAAKDLDGLIYQSKREREAAINALIRHQANHWRFTHEQHSCEAASQKSRETEEPQDANKSRGYVTSPAREIARCQGGTYDYDIDVDSGLSFIIRPNSERAYHRQAVGAGKSLIAGFSTRAAVREFVRAGEAAGFTFGGRQLLGY